MRLRLGFDWTRQTLYQSPALHLHPRTAVGDAVVTPILQLCVWTMRPVRNVGTTPR